LAELKKEWNPEENKGLRHGFEPSLLKEQARFNESDFEFKHMTEPDSGVAPSQDRIASFFERHFTDSTFLEANFSSVDFTGQFTWEKVGDYGGGPVYKVAKGQFERYIILAPGSDNPERIGIIIAMQDPRSS